MDNSNARDALVRGHADTKVVGRLVKLHRAHIQRLGTNAWFELITPCLNPADDPTRNAPSPSGETD